MKRRTFLKQAAAAAAGIAVGAKLPAHASGFPGVIGVDVARPDSDQTVIYLGYSNQLETHIWKQGKAHADIMDLYTKIMATAFAVPVEMLKDS